MASFRGDYRKINFDQKGDEITFVKRELWLPVEEKEGGTWIARKKSLSAAAKGAGALQLPDDISPAQEIALLEDYAARLQSEAAAFLEAWPDAKHAHEWFVMARSSVLKKIAKLTIDNIQKEFEPQENEQ